MDSCSGRFLLFVFVCASTYNNVEINLTIFHVGFFCFPERCVSEKLTHLGAFYIGAVFHVFYQED